MKILPYDDDRKLIFDEVKKTGRIVYTVDIAGQISDLKSNIAELKAVYNDNEKLLAWAKDEFESSSGLNNLKRELEEKEGYLA